MDVTAFAALIKRKRGEKRLTQETLAEDVFGDSTRKGDISRIENGHVTPQEATIQNLCKALAITNAELDPIRTARPSAKQLDHIPTLSRDELELLASRFDIVAAHDRPDADLRDLLTKKAEEYRSYRTEIEAIDERTKGLGNLKAAAQDAAERLDFEEVETLLGRVHEVELEIAAETAELRASNALLRGRVDQAYDLICGAADSFASINEIEVARRLIKGHVPIRDHSRCFGGNGHALASEMIKKALPSFEASGRNPEWANARIWLGVALQEQGTRTGGPKGAELLAQAVSAYRDALTVRTRAAHPVDWAMTQENMAIAEQAIANHDATLERRPHLNTALEHVDAALTVFDPEHMPYNHTKATALRDQITKALADLSDGFSTHRTHHLRRIVNPLKNNK